MAKINNRIIVYTKDVVIITGRTERTARRILTAIRKKYSKPPGALVSVSEFCEHTGLKEQIVIPFLT
jgi:hypothetical protein